MVVQLKRGFFLFLKQEKKKRIDARFIARFNPPFKG